MIYTDLTRKAIVYAYNAHEGQLDRGGIPYIFHPYHLAEQMTDELTACAEKQKITEQRREEFRRRMLTIAASMDKKRGISQKYKEPPVRLPREGIKERKW